MTKKFLILCLMAVFAIGASAQSIVGKWKTEPQNDKDGKMVYVLNFKDNENVELGVDCNMEDEEMILEFDIFLGGTYKRNGNNMTVNFESKDAKFNLKNLKFLGENAEMFKENPELEETMKKLMVQAIETQKEDMLDDFSTGGNLTIFELTDTTLKIGDTEESAIVFKKM